MADLVQQRMLDPSVASDGSRLSLASSMCFWVPLHSWLRRRLHQFEELAEEVIG